MLKNFICCKLFSEIKLLLITFQSTSGSDLNISHLEKYINWKYSETVRPSQNKTQGCCSEDINCFTSLFRRKIYFPRINQH